jgi:Pyruvate/2-oxoacid:ferredoxin oxidoreductase delta subunit
MTDHYERLADALEALPSGFPRVPSGVELRILQKAFKPEEAELAGQMGRTYETVAEIATRAGLPEARAKELLEGLLATSLVKKRTVDGVEKFRLGPFIVGWYESYVQRMPDDREFAELFERYVQEGGGERILSPRPGILGVVPVRGSVRADLLQPHEDIDAHFERHERFAVIDCVCRIERNLLGSDCQRPVKRCAFVGLPPQTPLSENVLDREQAKELFAKLEEQGHVHLGFYGFTSGADSPQFVGCCNCCGDCCGILRGTNDLDLDEGPQRSNYRAAIDLDSCIACGDCIERCQVKAITEGEDGLPVLDRDRCIGCGVCVIGCSGDAIELVPVSAGEWFQVPSSFEEWEERRLQSLGRTA